MAVTVANIFVEPMQVTWGSTDLGCTEGDTELSRDEAATDVVCHQTGTNVLDSINTGMVMTLSMVIKEFSVANFDELIAAAGGIKNTSAASDAYGFGFNRDFTGQLSRAQVLVLHPERLAAATKTSDWNFNKAYPVISGITWSGESTQAMSIEWKIFPDTSKATGLEYAFYGDGDLTYT